MEPTVGLLAGRVESALADVCDRGLLLVGVSLRLLRVREVPVADLLPALVVAPLLVSLAAALR